MNISLLGYIKATNLFVPIRLDAYFLLQPYLEQTLQQAGQQKFLSGWWIKATTSGVIDRRLRGKSKQGQEINKA